jgi:hypothetical protein
MIFPHGEPDNYIDYLCECRILAWTRVNER